MTIKHIFSNPLLTKEHIAALKTLIEHELSSNEDPDAPELSEVLTILDELEKNDLATGFSLTPYAG